MLPLQTTLSLVVISVSKPKYNAEEISQTYERFFYGDTRYLILTLQKCAKNATPFPVYCEVHFLLNFQDLLPVYVQGSSLRHCIIL